MPMPTSSRSSSSISRFAIPIVAVFMAISVDATTARAGFIGGHVFVTDRVFHDSDILEYDSNFNFVGSFRSGLPAGFSMNAGPSPSLRFGPDGDLYSVGELDGPGVQQTGVFDWSAPGILKQFYPTPTPFIPDLEGFDILPNGNFLIADLDTIAEVTRNFASTQFYAVTQGGGWQGIFIYKGRAFVVGAQELGGFDIGTRTQNFYYHSMTDNDDLAIRPDGVIALNYQFHDTAFDLANNTTDFIEFLSSNGTFLKKAFLPNPFWDAGGGMAFDLSGGLLVPSNEVDANGAIVATHLVRFDSNFNPIGNLTLAHWREAGGIAVAPGPEPAIFAFIGSGLLALAMWRKFRSH
jgi:hypothetical protein